MGPRKLAQLRQRMKYAGITQEAVAIKAGVSRTHVNHVLHGRAVSRNVIATAERLLADGAIPRGQP